MLKLPQDPTQTNTLEASRKTHMWTKLVSRKPKEPNKKNSEANKLPLKKRTRHCLFYDLQNKAIALSAASYLFLSLILCAAQRQYLPLRVRVRLLHNWEGGKKSRSEV